MTPNSALNSAIFESPLRTQRAVALKALVPETRLSAIVRGRVVASAQEKKRIAAALGVAVDQIFPPTDQALAS